MILGIYVFVPHLLLLTASTWYCCRRIFPKALDFSLCASSLIFWANILVASYICAIPKALDNDLYFLLASTALQCLFILYSLKFSRPVTVEHSTKLFLQDIFPKNDFFKNLFSWGVLAIIFSAFILSCLVPLQIPDTLVIKLPNTFFYLNEGTLIPPRYAFGEGRAFFAPFNGYLLWSYFMRWMDVTRPLLALNYFSGLLCLISVYRLSKLVGASRWASFAAASCLTFSLAVFYQMVTDNDDLLSLAPGIISTMFLLQWFLSTRARSTKFLAILAGTGMGISIGSKGLPLLYAPIFILLFFYFLIRYPKKFLTWLNEEKWSLGLAALFVVFFSVPYFVTLYIEYGRILLSAPMLEGLRKPISSYEMTIYNWVANHAQIWLNGIPDVLTFSTGASREKIVAFFNETLLPLVLPSFGANNGHGWGPDLTAVHIYDGTAWYGLTMLFLMPWSLFLIFKRKFFGTPEFWLALSFWIWGFVLSAARKYVPGIGRYWIMTVALLFPVWALYFDFYKDKVGQMAKLHRAVFLFSCFSSLWVAGSALTKTTFRYNFFSIFESEIWSPPPFSPNLLSVLKNNETIHHKYTMYGWPTFHLLNGSRGKKITFNNAYRDEVPTLIPTLSRALFYSPGSESHVPIPLENSEGSHVFYFTKSVPFGTHMFVRPSKDGVCVSCLKDRPFAIATVSIKNSNDIFMSLKKYHEDQLIPADTKNYLGDLSVSIEGLLPDHWELRALQEFLDDQGHPTRSTPLTEWTSKSWLAAQIPLDQYSDVIIELRDNKESKLYRGAIPVFKKFWGPRYLKWEK